MAEDHRQLVAYVYGRRRFTVMQSDKGVPRYLCKQVIGGNHMIDTGLVKLWYMIQMKDHTIEVYLSKYDERLNGNPPDRPVVMLR